MPARKAWKIGNIIRLIQKIGDQIIKRKRRIYTSVHGYSLKITGRISSERIIKIIANTCAKQVSRISSRNNQIAS